jgi:hypothetical protein
MSTGGYFMVTIGGYSINGYWWLLYKWLSVAILLMAIGCYYINDYWWLFYGDYWWLFYCWLLVVII